MLTFGLTLMALFSILVIAAVVRLVSRPDYPMPISLAPLVLGYLIGGAMVLLHGFIWLLEALL